MKTKIKSHGDKVRDFYDKNIPKIDSSHTCLAVISLDSALKEMWQFSYASVFKRV